MPTEAARLQTTRAGIRPALGVRFNRVRGYRYSHTASLVGPASSPIEAVIDSRGHNMDVGFDLHRRYYEGIVLGAEIVEVVFELARRAFQNPYSTPAPAVKPLRVSLNVCARNRQSSDTRTSLGVSDLAPGATAFDVQQCSWRRSRRARSQPRSSAYWTCPRETARGLSRPSSRKW